MPLVDLDLDIENESLNVHVIAKLMSHQHPYQQWNLRSQTMGMKYPHGSIYIDVDGLWSVSFIIPSKVTLRVTRYFSGANSFNGREIDNP